MKNNVNITRIKAVSNALDSLKENVVFVGGATVSLYADRETEDPRPTDDVDVLVEISSRKAYAELEQQLRNNGFQHDTTATFIGRFLIQGLTVDVMPTDETILGFSNQWYKQGFDSAINFPIDELHSVKIFPAPLFIAAKLEAFKNRGNNDGRLSSDFEDIIFILENRSTIWHELKNTSGTLKLYLLEAFNNLRRNKYINEWIEAHTRQRVYLILEGMDYFLSES